MEIDVLMRDWGPIDIAPLAEAIARQEPAAWNEHEQRQKDYEVHRQTQSIVLLFAGVDNWPTIEVLRMPGWDRLANVVVPLMDQIIARWYPPGGRIIRAMIARMPPGARIDPHHDAHPSFACGHRIHVPIDTNPRVRFTVDGRPFNLQAGRVYEINNLKTHSVINKGAMDRTHLIFDYVPVDREPGASAALPA
jgi:quercetin dioxygenase-like cupin family protein